MKNKIKKPRITDGAPKGFVGNHHLWFIKAYRKWIESKQNTDGIILSDRNKTHLNNCKLKE